jgi:hypothetical protein
MTIACSLICFKHLQLAGSDSDRPPNDRFLLASS